MKNIKNKIEEFKNSFYNDYSEIIDDLIKRKANMWWRPSYNSIENPEKIYNDFWERVNYFIYENFKIKEKILCYNPKIQEETNKILSIDLNLKLKYDIYLKINEIFIYYLEDNNKIIIIPEYCYISSFTDEIWMFNKILNLFKYKNNKTFTEKNCIIHSSEIAISNPDIFININDIFSIDLSLIKTRLVYKYYLLYKNEIITELNKKRSNNKNYAKIKISY